MTPIEKHAQQESLMSIFISKHELKFSEEISSSLKPENKHKTFSKNKFRLQRISDDWYKIISLWLYIWRTWSLRGWALASNFCWHLMKTQPGSDKYTTHNFVFFFFLWVEKKTPEYEYNSKMEKFYIVQIWMVQQGTEICQYIAHRHTCTTHIHYIFLSKTCILKLEAKVPEAWR